MMCTSPFRKYPTHTEWVLLGKRGVEKKYPLGFMEVPCGRCLACKIQKSREWTHRIMFELQSWNDAGFLTLTYDDNFLPKNYSLVKRDLQNFIKRFRRYLKDEKIKYYGCGEYGEDTCRPHYHLIIFGFGVCTALKHKHTLVPMKGQVFKVLSGPLVELWSNGFVSIGEVEYDSARYVTGYINKKYSGVLADKVYTQTKREIPFQVCSQGVGLDYAIKDSKRITENCYLSMRGQKLGIPRYFKKKLDFDKNLLEEQSRKRMLEEFERLTAKGCETFDDCFDMLDRERKQKSKNLRTRSRINEQRQRQKSDRI